MYRLILIPVIGLLIQGCGSTLKLDPEPLKGQKQVYNNGNEVIISNKKSKVAVSSLTTTYSSEDHPKIFVALKNSTTRPYNFSTENIQVFIDGKPHKVFTYNELVDQIETKQKWAAFGAALSAAGRSMSAANAGTTYHSGTYNSYAYNNYGSSAYGYGSYSGTSYNYAAAQQAQSTANAQTQADFQRIKNNTQQSLGAIDKVIKKTTIAPNAYYDGFIALDDLKDPSQPHTVQVLVTAGSEKHNFLFKHFKVK